MNNKFLDMVINNVQCIVINSPPYSVKISFDENEKMYSVLFLKQNLHQDKITYCKYVKNLKYARQISRKYLLTGTVPKKINRVYYKLQIKGSI